MIAQVESGFRTDKGDLDVFVVSDFTGETANSVAVAVARQFRDKHINIKRFRYIDTPEKIVETCKEAKDNNAVIVCTLVSKDVRDALLEESRKIGVTAVDLFGSLLSILSCRLDMEPLGEPGVNYKLDEDYFRRVKAIEYASTCDDGSNPSMLVEADLVIIGVSRTCKTPLAMYLANKGIKTANVPLVPELFPPEELFKLPPGRIVGLVVEHDFLKQIRRERLQMLGLDPDLAAYAKDDRVCEELDYSMNLFERLGAKVIDVTGRALEEIAQEVLDYLSAQGRKF